MSYKIAIASSNENNIDLSFGEATTFAIYEVIENKYHFVEKREIIPDATLENKVLSSVQNSAGCKASSGCGNSNNLCGTHSGCGAGLENFSKVELIADCRCVVCKKIGFNVTKQLEKKAIIGFDVTCTIKEALDKISNYFAKVDSHQSLRGTQKSN